MQERGCPGSKSMPGTAGLFPSGMSSGDGPAGRARAMIAPLKRGRHPEPGWLNNSVKPKQMSIQARIEFARPIHIGRARRRKLWWDA